MSHRIKVSYCPNFALCDYMCVLDKSIIILKHSSWLLHLLFLKLSEKQLLSCMFTCACMGLYTRQWSKDCTQLNIVGSAKVQTALYAKAPWSSGLRIEPWVMFYSNSRVSALSAHSKWILKPSAHHDRPNLGLGSGAGQNAEGHKQLEMFYAKS